MIVIPAALGTSCLPPANLTVLDRIGISIVRRLCGERREHAALHLAEVGRIVRIPVVLWLKIRPRHDHVHAIRRAALHSGKQVGVKTKLEHTSCPRFARELRIDWLVGPRPDRAWLFYAAQDVGAP